MQTPPDTVRAPAHPPGLALFVATAPEALAAAHAALFTRPLQRVGGRWRYLDARWWSLPAGNLVQTQIATTEAWLDLWARRHLTDPQWRAATGADASLHLTLTAVWATGAVARLAPGPAAHAPWPVGTGLVGPRDRPVGVALLDTWNPGSAHGVLSATASIPGWAWDGPTGTLLDPPTRGRRPTGRTGPRPGY